VRGLRHLELGITDKYVGKQYLDNTGSSGRMLDAYSYCNLLLHYTFKPRPFREVTANLQLNNIFDQLYSSNGATYPGIADGAVYSYNYYYPQAGFNVLGGITVRW
jgi:iron complex outermembrane receptor protein